jgi:hypothetical protein
MKALTVRQPWASLIVHGVKHIETRSKPTKIRGRIGIIAGKHRPEEYEKWGDWQYVPSRFPCEPDVLEHYASGMPGAPDEVRVTFGALIGTVELYDCVPISWPGRDLIGSDGHDITDQLPYGEFYPGRWAWLLRDPQPLAEPIPMRGAQHWQEVDV